MAYQDGSSVGAEPVKNNFYMAAPPDKRPPYWRRKKWARKVLAEFDLDIELFPDVPAGFLTMAERQLFEVAKALVTDPKVLLLDEPTTALGPDEVEALHRTVLACKRQGVGVVYVSHRLPEVIEVADRITVLRDGRRQGTFDAATTTSRPNSSSTSWGGPSRQPFPPGSDVRGTAGGAGGRRTPGPVVRAGQFHAGER
jgi:ribose transport system ATP-binding protein